MLCAKESFRRRKNYLKNKDDYLLQILQSPVNVISNQNLVNKKEKDLPKIETDTSSPYHVDYSFSESKEMADKYNERMVKKAQEDPDEVIIQTPRGPMTMAEAIKAGFNLETGQFEEEMLAPNMEDYGMDEATMEQLMQLMQDPTADPNAGEPIQEGLAPEMLEGEVPTEESIEEDLVGDLMLDEEVIDEEETGLI